MIEKEAQSMTAERMREFYKQDAMLAIPIPVGMIS